MLSPSVVKHMSSVEDYRQRLAASQGAWDTLSMLSHLSGDGSDMGSTRQAFEALATDLVKSLGDETHHKALLGLKAKSQIAIDVLVRNLFERTADIGFLSTDDDIREFAATPRDDAGGRQATTQLQRRFREYVSKYSVYDDVVLLAPDGEVLLRLNDRYAVARCTDPFVNATLATRAGYVETFGSSTLFPGAADKLIYSYRVVADNRTLGVLCLCFKFDDEVAGIFAKLREDADWTVFGFLDAEGKVLASSDPWQMPLGAPLPLALNGGAIIRFAGREYLAVTCRTQGYQGYMGPGWYGHAMIPLEHAFDRGVANTSVSERMLADLRESPTIFSEELRRIPIKADQIQRELNRAVWNGNVRLAQRAATNNNFSKVLLREIGNAGRRTQETFERSMGDLQRTVVSTILEDAQQLASLAVDVLDRNLYERANDCRWWALNASLIGHVTSGEPSREEATTILRHINSLYTVYHDIVLFDANKRVCAVSNAAHAKRVGEVIGESWAAATLALRGSQDFATSAFEPSPFYANEHTLVFGAGIRSGARTVGGIGIVFDTKPQLAAMLRDALPRDEDGKITAGCCGVFVDKELRVVATTGDHVLGARIDLPAELIGAQTARLVQVGDSYYAAGVCRTSGYREYAGLGLTAIVLIPLGPVRTRAAAPSRQASHQNLHRHLAAGEQALDVATFRTGQQWLGLLREQVVESVDGSSLRAVPGAPAWHAGLLMYRDMPLPVIDLAQMVERTASVRGHDVVIARSAENAPLVGLLIDELDDIPEIAANRILPVADFAQRGGPNIVDRAVRPSQPDDPVLFLVNLDQVLLYVRAFAGAPRSQTTKA
jgi:chemotaxis signal transduction protein